MHETVDHTSGIMLFLAATMNQCFVGSSRTLSCIAVHGLPTNLLGIPLFSSTFSLVTNVMMMRLLLKVVAFALLNTDLASGASVIRPRAMRYDCVPAPILAPLQDCRKVLSKLYEMAQTYPTKHIKWGRNIEYPSDDPGRVSLPHGFQLELINPVPGDTPNKCEIHVDNDIQRLDTQEEFDLTAMVLAGFMVTDYCIASEKGGKAFPGPYENVYVTTIYTPGPSGGLLTAAQANSSIDTTRSTILIGGSGLRFSGPAFSTDSPPALSNLSSTSITEISGINPS